MSEAKDLFGEAASQSQEVPHLSVSLSRTGVRLVRDEESVIRIWRWRAAGTALTALSQGDHVVLSSEDRASVEMRVPEGSWLSA